MTRRTWLIPVLFTFSILMSCTQNEKVEEMNNVGYAQGTTFQIKYLSKNGKELKSAFDSIFISVDNSVSTYDSTSIISLVNSVDSFIEVDQIFMNVLSKAQEIAKESNGDFDISIGPLTNLLGFGLSKKHQVDSSMVDSVRQLVDYRLIKIKGNQVYSPKGVEFDFNAIAQGYTVDLIAEYIESEDINDYMVEVGGEVRAKGLNGKGDVWKIGVDKPQEELDQESRFQFIVELKNASLASSGNYRKFWVDEETGVKYAHTIDPKTGFPAKNKLLGVSIIAQTAMDADAYATLCMVKGVQESIKFLNSKDGLEGYLVYTNDKGDWEVYQTEGFKSFVIN